MSHKTIERDGITYTPEQQDEHDKREAKAEKDMKKIEKQAEGAPNEPVTEEEPKRGRK